MKKKLLRAKSGFTLIEMLVVIGIIGVILSVVTVSFGSAQRKARDTRRRDDLRSMQNCLEQYYSTNTVAPFQYPNVTVSSGSISAPCDSSATPQILTITDPLNTGTYVYQLNSDSDVGYSIQATLEGNTSPNTIVISNLQ